VDEGSRAAKVVAEVPNPDGALRGGLFVRGRIITGTRQGVLHVPREALLNWNVEQHTADVFVVEDGQARKCPVRIGTVSETTVEISSGVDSGDVVVTRGAFALRDGDKVAMQKGEKS
jgi:membrane fusion protein (multidrug efflux system)